MKRKKPLLKNYLFTEAKVSYTDFNYIKIHGYEKYES